MADIKKNILFLSLLLALFIPYLNNKFKWIELSVLNGFFQKTERPALSFKDWLAGSYQDSLIKYQNENIGFRPFFVRLRNQIYWWSDKKSLTKNVVVGKDDFLFEQGYIDAYLGKDRKDSTHFNRVVSELKLAQDSLEKKGISFLVVLAPGKASFFPEYIPDDFLADRNTITNYQLLSASLKKHNVNTIDFYDWYLEKKQTTEFPLYSKGGIHWSNYGCWLAMDSLIRYYENYFQKNMVSLQLGPVQFSDSVMKPDNDIGESMNLLFPLKPTRMAYPKVSWEKNETAYMPKLFAVADSYFWQMYSNGFDDFVFSDLKFNYYNQLVYSKNNKGKLNEQKAESFIFGKFNTDAVLMVVTEANLKDFPWGFEKQLREGLNLEGKTELIQKAIREMEEKIRNSPDWMKSIQEKALQRNVSVDSMIKMDARWMIINQEP
jgi:hypothetical protein